MQNYLHCSKSPAYDICFLTKLLSLQNKYCTNNSPPEKQNKQAKNMLPLQKYSRYWVISRFYSKYFNAHC